MQNEHAAQVHLTKSFPVSKDQLYKAWTSPEALKQWWRPMNKQLQNVENDIREGGRVAYQFEEDLRISGEYKEVEAGSKLVYSWNWELPEESLQRGEYLLTVVFKEEAEGSALEVTQENFHDEHAVKPHQTGWEEALEGLKQYLANGQATV